MSAHSLWDVQSGVYACLAADTALGALLPAGGGVFDHVPPQTPFPYVVIGETAARPLDAQGAAGHDVTLAIHVYSRGTGMKELRQVMTAVYEAMHVADFAVPGQTLALCRCQSSETALEGDGMTRHGVLRFQIITEPAEE